MRKPIILFAFIACLPISLFSQAHNLSGNVLGEKGAPLIAATAVLLNPNDSTLEFFGITDDEGAFEIKRVRPGNYLMQIAYLGYEAWYKAITVPFEKESNLGVINLQPKSVSIKEVQVTAEYVPIQIKNDTVEFNARAFKTIPDANVETLLRKLPGVEVDRDGNIKGFGKDIKKVLVDGKEFFGNDAKMATRNIPADAIDKIQMYDKRSDESEFTGVDDGTRDKTLNLMLKEDRKKGIFGDVTAGGGTDYHYTASAKLYRFVGKTQMALLGMMNDINKFGFTTGLGGVVSDGQTYTYGGASGSSDKGTASSGAGGANFSYSWGKEQRVFASYMMNGVNRNIKESIKTKSFIPGAPSKDDDEVMNQIQRDTSHRLNFGLRNRIDSSQTLLMNGNASFVSKFSPKNSLSNSFTNELQVNKQNSSSSSNSTQVVANANASYLKKLRNKRSVFKIGARGSFQSSLSESSYRNTTEYFIPSSLKLVSRFQDIDTRNYNYDGNISLSHRISGLLFLEPEFVGGENNNRYSRKLGEQGDERIVIDTISPDFVKRFRWLRPEIGLKWNTKNTQFTATLAAELGEVGTALWDEVMVKRSHFYFTPSIFWQREFRSGRMLTLNYNSSVNTPSVSQLLPIADYTNPLSITLGNRNLKPEYIHNINLYLMLVDGFSSTFLVTQASGAYIQNKINWSRVYDDHNAQKMTLVNVKDHYTASGNVDFSTAIRAIGTKIRTKFGETYNRGISIVNGIENINATLAHNFSLSLENRNKNKVDVSAGVSATITNAWYSIQESLNNQYFDVSYFSDISYYPNDTWRFSVSADVTNYSAKSFDAPISVPLLGAEISYSFLKNNRGLLTLTASDLLNKNTGISRVSEMNYLMERQSNMIGRYVMFTFKYKINKFGK